MRYNARTEHPADISQVSWLISMAHSLLLGNCRLTVQNVRRDLLIQTRNGGIWIAVIISLRRL